MKRLTERMVSSGRSPASALARAPTITSPPGRKLTAEGSSAAPVSGSGSTRGPLSSSTATRLLVVPRSMPMIRPTKSFSHRVLDVPEKRAQVGDLGEPAPELVERRRAAVGRGVEGAELVAEGAQAGGEAVAQALDLPAQLGAPRGTQLLELLLRLEHLGRDRRGHLRAAVAEPRAAPLEPVAAPCHGVAQRTVGPVHRRARRQRELALAPARGLEAVGVDPAPGGLVTPVQVRQVERELPRQVEDGEEISVRGEGLDGRATRAHGRRAGLRAALPTFPPCVRCRLHRSRVPSPDQTTNEEPQPQVRFTFGLRRLKPEAISSSL